jgi:hypothetical protein
MATEQEKTREKEEDTQTQRLRGALNDAYAFVLGQQSVRSFAAYTFEDALDAQIERIDGTSTAIRPNELERVERIREKVVAAAAEVEELREIEVQEWEKVNTPS